jgi:predicted DNA-binding protein
MPKKLLFPNQEKVTISLRMPIELVQKCNDTATEYDVTANQLMVRIIEAYFEEEW